METLELQAAQEVQEVLLFSLRELVEVVDDRVRFRRSERRVPRALVRLDRLDEVLRPAVVQEEDPLTDTPQGSASKLASVGYTLADIVEITLRKMRRDKVSPPFISRAFNLDSVLTSLPASSATSPKRSNERRTHAA